jgi:hypothetical protein
MAPVFADWSMQRSRRFRPVSMPTRRRRCDREAASHGRWQSSAALHRRARADHDCAEIRHLGRLLAAKLAEILVIAIDAARRNGLNADELADYRIIAYADLRHQMETRVMPAMIAAATGGFAVDGPPTLQ